MCTLRPKETIQAVLYGTEGKLITYCALCTLTEKAFPVHWLNWETSLWKYSLDTQYPPALCILWNNNRQVVLLCDFVLCSASASCQISAQSAPGPSSLLWQSHQILFRFSLPLLADLMLVNADARKKTVSNPLWVQLKINSSTSTEPGNLSCCKYLFSLFLGDIYSVWSLKWGNGQSTQNTPLKVSLFDIWSRNVKQKRQRRDELG